MDANKLIELSQDFICTTDFKGRFTYVNPACFEILGYTQDELTCKEFMELVHSDDVEKTKNEFDNLLHGNNTISFENRYFNKDGTIKYFSWKATSVQNEKLTYATGRDITEQKEAEEQLKASNEREKQIANIVRESPMAIAFGYPDGRLENCNIAFSELTGYTNAELHKINWNEVLTPAKWKIHEAEQLKKLSSTQTNVKYEKEYIRKDGYIVPIELVVTAKFDSKGNIIHYIAFITDITERKQTENELLENQKCYKKAQAMGHVGNWEYNLYTEKFWASDESKRIYGFGIDSVEFTTEKVESCIPERERVHQALIELIEKDKEYNLVFDLITHDKGIRKTIHSIAETERDDQDNIIKITGVISDITQSKQAELELQEQNEEYETLNEKLSQTNEELYIAKEKAEESENKIRSMVDNTHVGIIYCDITGKIHEVNPIMLKILGSPSIEATKQINILTFEPLRENGFAENLEKCIAEKRIITENTVYKSKWGKPIFMKYYLIPVIVDKEVIGVWANLNNLTDLYDIQNKLKAAQKKAEESDALKSAFLTNMSHEIRTPLNAVLGFSELLARENLANNEKANFAEYIRLNGESLAKIIDDIIDISKLQSKQLTIENESFNLHTLFNELHNYYDSLLIQKSKSHIKLVLNLPEVLKTDFYIKSDEQRLKQILNNLISNAIKYSEKGQITFGCNIEENKLNFFVKDTGFGIPPENIGQIFERFIQFSPEYISKQEGTGLGLSICKNLVSLLGGELQVESKVNKGSTFFFEIPLVKVDKPAKQKEDTLLNLKKDLSKYRILIADDEDSNYVLTKRILRPTKVTTDWAQNGKHAVEMAKNTNYDLILMDIKMPEMDGIEATRLIKKHNKNIPIVMQTAFAMKEVKDEAIDAGCDGFIVKPIALNAFLELVNKHIIK